MDDLFACLAAACLMGGGGNEGNAVPIDDIQDFNQGAKYIPGEVTMARRKGERVVYHPEKNQWQMPDGNWVG